MAEHSGWSASGFEAMMLCPGKKVMEQGLPSYANSYSAEGTVAHLVLTWALREQRDAAAYIGRVVHLDELGNVCEPVAAKFTFEVTDDMAEDVQVTIDYVRQVAGDAYQRVLALTLRDAFVDKLLSPPWFVLASLGFACHLCAEGQEFGCDVRVVHGAECGRGHEAELGLVGRVFAVVQRRPVAHQRVRGAAVV